MGAILFGTAIGLINYFNYQKSPEYEGHLKKQDSLQKIRLVSLCLVKGYIYTVFFPLPIIDMVFNLNDKKKFERHFIPFSIYGQIPKEKKD